MHTGCANLRLGERDIVVVAHPDLPSGARVRATLDFLIELFHRDARLWSGAEAPPAS